MKNDCTFPFFPSFYTLIPHYLKFISDGFSRSLTKKKLTTWIGLRALVCARQSRVILVLVKLKKRNRSFEKRDILTEMRNPFTGKKKEQNIKYNLKICNVSITRENY